MSWSLKTFTGFNEKTAENIQMDAGAFFINFDVEKDTYASAKADGRCLGATQGGGEFTAKPTISQIQVDGVKGRARGLVSIDKWDVSLKATLLETTVETIKRGLGFATADASAKTGYTKIVANGFISDADYVKNLTWVGCKLGSKEPIIIQLFNALNESGLSYKVSDGSQGKVELELYGYNDGSDYLEDVVPPPFAIYLPDLATDADAGEGGGTV